MNEIVHVAEIGTAGAAASVAALHLGLNQVPSLMIIFFSVTLAGQFVSACLDRVAAAAIRNREPRQ